VELKPISNLWLSLFTKSDFSFTPKPNLGAQNPVYNGVLCYGEDLSNYSRLNQLELKWLIKAYQTTNNKSKFFNPFYQTCRN
jgi:hypothetical protein